MTRRAAVCITGADGVGRLEGLRPGPCELKVYRHYEACIQRTVQVSSGGVERLELQLPLVGK